MPLPVQRFSRFSWSLIAGLLAMSSSAPAAVVLVDWSAAPVTIPATIDGLYLNLPAQTTSTAAVPPTGWDFNIYSNGTTLTFFTPAAPSGQGTLSSGPVALALLAGQSISSAGSYQPGQSLGNNFNLTATQYVGMRFYNETTTLTHYGWVQVRTTGGAGNGFPASVVSYAWEDTGAAILAGQVPEPTAVGLLGLTLGGLGLRRRRNA